MSEVIFLDNFRPSTPQVEFSQCPKCLTYFGFTDHADCPACKQSFTYLPDVDDELRVFVSS